jgi:hypothetical protein
LHGGGTLVVGAGHGNALVVGFFTVAVGIAAGAWQETACRGLAGAEVSALVKDAEVTGAGVVVVAVGCLGLFFTAVLLVGVDALVAHTLVNLTGVSVVAIFIGIATFEVLIGEVHFVVAEVVFVAGVDGTGYAIVAVR